MKKKPLYGTLRDERGRNVPVTQRPVAQALDQAQNCRARRGMSGGRWS
jgi:hypothetical protein